MMRLLVSILLLLGIFAVNSYGEDFLYIFTEEDIPRVAVKQRVMIDNIVINPSAKIVRIRTFIENVDKDGNVVSRQRGKSYLLRDRKDDPETPDVNEASNDYTILMKQLGLSKKKLVQALKTMELDKKEE